MERELSLHIPAAARAGVNKAMRSRKAKQISLRALYFDTESRTLARAGVALRVRREGKQWIQTVKAPGDDPLSRIEINHPRPLPELDLSLYDDTPLAEIFAGLQEPLALRYETDVKRLTLQEERDGTVIEIARDDGSLRAHGWTLPIHEIEFELLSGPIEPLFGVAREWLVEHRLILETRSKAQRGDRLARLDPAPETDETHIPAQLFKARRAENVRLTSDMSTTEGYVACAGECLIQIMSNAAMLAGVDSSTSDETARATQVHQLRVGVRRLRSCWKLFKDLVPAVDSATEEALKTYFRILGDTRNQDVIRLIIAPRLRKVGMPDDAGLESDAPAAQASADGAVSIQATLAGPKFQSVLLVLLEHVVTVSDTGRDAPDTKKKRKAKKSGQTSLAQALPDRLHRWWESIMRDGCKFDELSIDDQHAVRKRIKVMRYGLEFSAGLMPKNEVSSVAHTLSEVQELLGDLNDYYVAEDVYRNLENPTAGAWYAIGWLEAMQAWQISLAKNFFMQYRAPTKKKKRK